ncbi:YrrS family protein [Halobacillus mangrovi]|uniref:YrrS family protein n=1 Tax=Halobacillus mangrovi TaxID=402384 RepID=UPI003D958A5F
MANQNKPYSRSSRTEKRIKGTKMLTMLLGAAGLIIVVYISVMIFGVNNNQAGKALVSDDNKTEEKAEEENSNEGSSDEKPQEDLKVNEEKSKEDSSDDKEKKENKEESDKEEEGTVTESDKENVDRVITKDWEPVPTEQETDGSHSILYKEGTQDWEELEQAARNATGLSEGDMITWFIGNNNSPTKAKATVSNKAKTENYRVYIEWVDGKGYKPTQVEVLNSNPRN